MAPFLSLKWYQLKIELGSDNMFTVWAVNVFSQNIDWQKDHDVGCLNCQKFPPRYIFVKTLSVALAKSSISNIEAIYIKKSVSETVCAKHSLFFVLLYLNQVGLVVCKFTKLVLESFMNYSREVPSVFSLRPTRLIKTVWAIKIVLVYSLVFLFFF